MPAGGTRTPASAETVAANDHTVRMPNGREVFKRAVTEMASACRQLLEKSGHTIDDVDVLIPHQANARIMTAVVDRLGIDPAKAVVDVAEVGNTERCIDPGRARPGMASRHDQRGRSRAVHLVRRRAHVGRHARALDPRVARRGRGRRVDRRGSRVTSKVAVVTGASRGIGRACAGRTRRGRLDRRDRATAATRPPPRMRSAHSRPPARRA